MKVIETAELPAKLMLYFISYVGWAALTGPQWPQPADRQYPLVIMGTSGFLISVPFCCQNNFIGFSQAEKLTVKRQLLAMLPCHEDNNENSTTKSSEFSDSTV